MLKKIPNIDLEVTGVCNLRCPGCWGTPRMMPMTRTFDELFNLLKKLSNYGLKSVTLSGGEPTLVRGLDDFIVKVHSELGLEIYLQTNGFFLIRMLPKVAPHLHTISLSLEGSNTEVNSFRRGSLSFDKVMNCLAYLDEHHPDIKIKIGTCVFKQNIADMPRMGEVLLEHGFGKRFPDLGVWKLYQVTRFGAGKEDALLDSMLLTDEEFQSMSDLLKQKFAGKINVTTIATKDMGGYCIIVRPDGKVVSNAHSDKGEETTIFDDIFNDLQGGVDAIIKFQDAEHVKNRLEKTYFFEWEKQVNAQTTAVV